MKFNDAHTHLSAYLDGELDEPTRRQLEAALDAQPELRAELDSLRRTAELVRSLPRQRAPDGFAARVRDAVAAGPHAERRRGWPTSWRTVAAAAACLIVGLVALLVPRGDAPRDLSRAIDRPDTETAERKSPERPPAERDGRLEEEEHLAEHDEAAKLKRMSLAERRAGVRGTSPKGAARGPAASVPGEAAAARTVAGEKAGTDRGSYGRDEELALRKTDQGARPGGPPSPAPPGPMVVAKAEEPGTPSQRHGGRGRLDKAPYKKAKTGPRGLHAGARNGFRATGRGEAEADKVLAMAEVMVRDIPGPVRRSPAETARELSSLARRIEEGRRAARARTSAVAKTPAAPRRAEGEASREVVLEYVDLVPCLARASVALRDAGVPYAIQPQGSGCFVVTTSVTQKQIRRLLPLLERAARPVRGWVKEESAVRRELADASIEAKQRTAQRLHFVVRFRRASPPAAPRPE